MKVLHVIQTMATRYGGPVASLRALSHCQVRAGDKVTICTTNTDYPTGILPVSSIEPVVDNGVTIRFHSVQFQSLLLSFSLMKWIRASIKDFDILHIHGLYRFPVTYAAWVARMTEIPYVITPHGALDPFLYKQSRHSLLLKRLYERLFDFPNLNGASAINYTTEEELDRAKFLEFSAPTVVVPSGIDWAEYAQLPHRGNFRNSIGMDMDTPLVLFLGRLNFKKGLDLLIPAFSMVSKVLPMARLAVVGPDNEGFGRNVHRWCRKHGIEENVYMADHLSAEQVRQAYVDADVFVLPSFSENFGRTVVEAMACECPVVVSDKVNIWPEVKKAEAGMVVGLDIQEIARATLTILEDMTIARRMGDAIISKAALR